MYKVFFVDDEAAMRAGLRNSVNWGGSGFVLAGEAPDGELALSMVAEILPDILITDVKMPFMDGLELSRRVKRTMPWVKIIILSGHDEFEYAKQAIRIGVSEYLLKPITSEALLQTLSAVARQIEAEKEGSRVIESLKKGDLQRLRTAKLLSDLAYGVGDRAELLAQAEALGIPVGAGCYLVALIEIRPKVWDEGQVFSGARSLAFAVLSSNESMIAFAEGAERIVCVLSSTDEETLEEDVYAAAQALKYEVERNTPCLVSVAVGSPVGNLSELSVSMGNAKKTRRYLEKTGRPLIAGIKDIDAREYKFLLESQDGLEQHADVIEKARDYIAGNYTEHFISLNTVAKHVNMSPNHFSTVFSQKTGETFIEYLTQMRLNKAKALLKTTAARTSEIAYLVGYNDPHYFSYVFKKNVGLSPKEFRK